MMIYFYKKQWMYFQGTHMRSLLLIFGFFLVCNTVSYIGIVQNSEEVANMKLAIVDMLGGVEKIKEIKESEQTTLLHYLKNNVSLLILLFLVGLIPLYVGSFLIFLPNALLLGVVMGISKIERDSAFTDVLVTIGPHGITEFLSIFTAAALSLYLSHTVTRKIFSTKRKEIFFQANFRRAFMFFLSVSIPLMVISAILETYVTPIIIQHFLPL
jgi:uncharacterized membrane protein SpoIIM required for sporulation